MVQDTTENLLRFFGVILKYPKFATFLNEFLPIWVAPALVLQSDLQT